MNDADKLFQENPLKALWISNSEINRKLDRIVEELDSDDINDDYGEDNGY